MEVVVFWSMVPANAIWVGALGFLNYFNYGWTQLWVKLNDLQPQLISLNTADLGQWLSSLGFWYLVNILKLFVIR